MSRCAKIAFPPELINARDSQDPCTASTFTRDQYSDRHTHKCTQSCYSQKLDLSATTWNSEIRDRFRQSLWFEDCRDTRIRRSETIARLHNDGTILTTITSGTIAAAELPHRDMFTQLHWLRSKTLFGEWYRSIRNLLRLLVSFQRFYPYLSLSLSLSLSHP